MTRLKVEGHDSLVRDETNNAIINTDKTAYSVYMKKVITRKQETEKVRGLVREVNELREDMKQIKKLLGKMVENNGR